MSLSISTTNPSIVVDSVGRTLSFVPADGSKPESFANAPQWALDFLGRAANARTDSGAPANLDSVESVLLFVGFKPDQDVTGPQVDGRLKRGRQLSQHDAQSGLPASGPTIAKARGLLTIAREQGLAAGLDSDEIADYGRDFRRAKDQAKMSLFIRNISLGLVDVGLLDLSEVEDPGTTGTGTTPTDAPAPAGSDIDWTDE